MAIRNTVAVLGAIVVVLIEQSWAGAENWPNWRGPQQDGVSRETALPLVWSEHTGIDWKCKLPEWGNSTPVIWDDAIFLTSHVDDQRLLLLRIDKKTGAIVWSRQVGTGSVDRPRGDQRSGSWRGQQKFHPTQNLATPSAVTDGEVVVAHFGNGDLAAYDFDGNQLWKRNLQADYGKYTIWWGHANSPVLYRHMVISVCMQDSCEDIWREPSPSYLVANDKRTGREVWKTMRMTGARREECDAYTTPLLHPTAGGMEMIVMGGLVLDAYDPYDGKRLWQLSGLDGNRVITGPVIAHDMVYLTEGMREAIKAVRLGRKGELTRRDVVWTYDQGTPDSPTPVVWEDLLFFVDNNGVAKCLDAFNGALEWKQRLKGGYRGSPLAAEHRIYFLNMEGLATVISAASRFDRLAENRLDDTTIASPVASDGKLFIRGHKWLYCIGR